MKIKTISVFLCIICVTGLLLFQFKKETTQEILPLLGNIGSFVLTDNEHQQFDSSNLQGSVWIANFSSTKCGDSCGLIAKNMAALHRSYDLQDDVFMLSITDNPEQDTAHSLQQYILDHFPKYKVNKKKWFFLTGSEFVIHDMVLNFFKSKNNKSLDYTKQLILIDQKNIIRGYYDGTDMKVIRQIFKDIAQLTQ